MVMVVSLNVSDVQSLPHRREGLDKEDIPDQKPRSDVNSTSHDFVPSS